MKSATFSFASGLHDDRQFTRALTNLVRSADFRDNQARIEAGSHPTADMLHDYAWESLTPEFAQTIRAHAAFCAPCARAILRLRQLRLDAERDLLHWADASLAPLTDMLADEFWMPVGAGEALVAATSAVTQAHEFSTPFGAIYVTCAWGEAVADDPAFVWLSWNAGIPDDREFSIRLINPENQAIRYEIRPGRIRRGDQTFTSDALGFDPMRDKWGIAVALPETQA